jgi:hypothetical protein
MAVAAEEISAVLSEAVAAGGMKTAGPALSILAHPGKRLRQINAKTTATAQRNGEDFSPSCALGRQGSASGADITFLRLKLNVAISCLTPPGAELFY